MAADQSLISASLKEAQSRVGPDKTKFYESNVNRIANTMTNISNIFKQKEIDTEKSWEAIAGNTEKMMNSLASEDQLGNMGQANIDHLKSLKQEFLSAGNNKDEQNKVKIKIEKVVKTINKLAAGFGKYGEAYINDTLDRSASDPSFTGILGRIWEKDEKYDDTQFNWTEDGDLEITVDGVATNSSMLFDKLVLKNDAVTNELGKMGINAESRGLKGLESDRNTSVQAIKSLFGGAEGRNKFATIVNSSTFGKESFIEALVNNEGIHKTLQDLKKFDNNSDGKVTAADFATDENKAKLINALTNVHSDSFDFESAKQVAAEWYNDSYLQSKYDDGTNAAASAAKKTNSNSGRDTLPVNYGSGYITRTKASNVLDSMKSKKRTVTYDGQQISYDEKLDTYTYDETKEPISNYDILRGHEIWDQGYQMPDFAGTQKQSDNKQISENSTDYNPNENKNKKGPAVPIVTSGGRF